MTKKDCRYATPYLLCAVCSNCQKCAEVCPAGIDIPEALRLYGEHRGDVTALAEKLRGMPAMRQPLDCIECGACTAHCPQNLDVKGIIRELSMLQLWGGRGENPPCSMPASPPKGELT